MPTVGEASSIGAGLELRERVTWIGHHGRRYWNPISPERVDAWVTEAPLPRSASAPNDAPQSSVAPVLDIGCGSGALVLHAAEARGCVALGIDPLKPAIEQARADAARRGLADRAEFRCQTFEDAEVPEHHFGMVACLGASHAFNGWRGAMEVLPNLLVPGGLLLLGEGYWQRTPDEEYLDFLGCEEDVYLSHEHNQELAREHGLEVLRAHEANDAEWVAFEDGYASNLHSFVAAHPTDSDADAILDRITAWRDAYLEWGVDTLGFGLYLLKAKH